MENYDRDQLYTKDVHIYVEANPNPGAMKFVANFMLMPEGESRDYPTLEQSGESPLAQELFKFDYVTRVFFMSNFVTVTKSEDKDWIEIQDEIRLFIKGYLEAEKPVFNEEVGEEVANEDESEIDSKIKEILDEYVRPAVESDGGAIAFKSFENGVVTVQLQGSCSGCPSSTITLKSGIEALLKRALPEVESVEAESL